MSDLFSDPIYCRHNALAASCEHCAHVNAVKAGNPVVQLAALVGQDDDRAPSNDPALGDPEPVVVDEDTWVEHPVLPGSYVLVREGDEVPRELVDAPRRAVGDTSDVGQVPGHDGGAQELGRGEGEQGASARLQSAGMTSAPRGTRPIETRAPGSSS